jgi:glucan phosphoethanolaminetransferase (alkaline phosphatase superfamily)
VTYLSFLCFLLIAFTNESLYKHLVKKDGSRSGAVFEHLTVVVLVVAIAAGVYLLWRLRKRLPLPWLKYWMLLCTAGAVYFAGEEASWGQWYFGWETPEEFARLNRQGETNLHNTSEALNYYPKLLSGLFVVLVGWLIPWTLHLRGWKPRPQDWLEWILAPRACWPVGFLFLVFWICSEIELSPLDRLGASEWRELWIAWFLTLYLISYAVRLRSEGPGIHRATGEIPKASQPQP